MLDTDIYMTMLLISVGGLLVYVGPAMTRLKIKGNQMALTYGLPDALDLMVVCVESGLTVDGMHTVARQARNWTPAHAAP